MSEFIFKEINDGSQKYTDFLVENEASFTQSFYYGNWHQKMGRTIYRYAIENTIGDVVCFMQFIEVKVGSSQRFFYSPYGPIIDKKYSEKILPILKNEILKFLKEKNGIFFRLDVSQKNMVMVGESGLFKKAPKYSFKGVFFQPRSEAVLDIEQSEDTLLRNLDKKHRYSIRNAEKNNAEILFVKNNLNEYFDKFYNLMSETANRNDFNLHPKKYYEEVFKSIEENKNGHLVISKINGEITNILLFVYFGKTAMFLFGASADNHRNIPTSHFCHWKNILYLKETGIKYYNFGGISTKNYPDKNLISLTRFKNRFGGDIIEHSAPYDVVGKKLLYNLFLLKKFVDRLRK